MEEVITIKNLYKSFGDKLVINDLSFEVNQGEIFAFLGPNGSGKTTTIRCLLHTYKADSGELLINGKQYSTEMSQILGYLPEERGLYLNSKVLETIIYFGQLKGLSKVEATKNAKDYLAKVGLSDKAQSQIKKLSSGQQQKIQLGITIINNPKILILDEPTKGLDPVNKALLLEILFDLNKNGSTIIFSTHQMDEVEKIANRLIMIKEGKKTLYGKVNEVRKASGKNIIYVEFKGERFPTNSSLYTIRLENNYAEIYPNPGINESEILNYLVIEQVDILSYKVDLPTLNDVFLNVMSTPHINL